MKCKKVQSLFSDRHNGELSPGVERSVEDHLGHCGLCREMAADYGEMMQLLDSTEAAELPVDFEATLHQRLVVESAGAIRGSNGANWLRPALRSVGLVLAGAAAVGLFFLAGQRDREPTSAAAPSCPAVVDDDSVPTHELALGQVAIVNLAVESLATPGASEVEVEIVLPDGLTLVGENYTLLPEKVVVWTADLTGENNIRIPVKADRPGAWLVVARARVGDAQITSETRLVVAPA